MIKREFYKERLDGVKLYRTWSDLNMKIRQVGTEMLYDEAVDVENADYIYEETDIPIDDLDLSAEEALKILMGGDIGEVDESETPQTGD